jgi:hypothetical protein
MDFYEADCKPIFDSDDLKREFATKTYCYICKEYGSPLRGQGHDAFT